MYISETAAASGLKIGRLQTANSVNESKLVFNVKVISGPWPKVIYIRKLKSVFLRNHRVIFNQILYVSF